MVFSRGGGAYLDDSSKAGVLYSAFYSSACKGMALKLPRSLEDLHRAAHELLHYVGNGFLIDTFFTLDSLLFWIKFAGKMKPKMYHHVILVIIKLME
jgi:hypothetical protein